MITLVSLGMSCQTAHQLAQYADLNARSVVFVKGPFDWLICPPSNAADWLNANLRDFDVDDIVEYRGRAYWPEFDFWFWHGFIDHSDDRRTVDLAGYAERELSKLVYQRNRFSALDASRTLFFVSNTQNNLIPEVFETTETHRYSFELHEIEKLQISLDGFFHKSTNLHVLSRFDRIDPRLLQQANVHVLPVDNSEWKGSSGEWKDRLDHILASEKPHTLKAHLE